MRTTLCQRYKALGRALALRDALQDLYEAPRAEGPGLLRQWCAWAGRSRLEPFQKLARTIRQYWDGIVSYFNERITQGAIEAINGIIQLAKRRARGFRNFVLPAHHRLLEHRQTRHQNRRSLTHLKQRRGR